MSKNYVAVLKAARSIKGQSYLEGTELGTVSVDALKGFDAENIVTSLEAGVIDLVDPEVLKKKQAEAKKKTEAKDK